MQESATEYLQLLLNDRTQEFIFDEFLEASKQHRTILVSASVEPIVKALAEAYDLEYLSSTLEIKDGHYTGRLLKDLSGKKLAALMERYGPSGLDGESHCYTDNLSDYELAVRCKYRTIILLKPRHRQRWGTLQARFVEDFA